MHVQCAFNPCTLHMQAGVLRALLKTCAKTFSLAEFFYGAHIFSQ